MKKKMIMGLIILASLALGACGHRSASGRKTANSGGVAFGQVAQRSRAHAWYVATSRTTPKASTPLTAIVMTQNGRATAFRVPATVTLGVAVKLSTDQLARKGKVWAEQAFVERRRALIATTRAELAEEQKNLKRNQNATVVSFATIKMDKRIISTDQRQLARLQATKFKQPRPLPISVTVKKNRRGTSEVVKVDSYDFVKAVTATNNREFRYQKTRRQISSNPYTQTSEQAVRVGQATLGYYQTAHDGAREFALTKLDKPRSNVKFDS